MMEQVALFDVPPLVLPVDPDAFDVMALPFAHPFGEAVVRPVPAGATAPHPKRIDNRSRTCEPRRGKFIAIRTTQTIDGAGVDWLNATYGYGWTAADLLPSGLILGVARVVGFVTDDVVRPWYRGPMHAGKRNVGWVLDDVVAFADPVPFVPKFGLGLSALPPDVYKAVRERWIAGRVA